MDYLTKEQQGVLLKLSEILQEQPESVLQNIITEEFASIEYQIHNQMFQDLKENYAS